MIGYPIDWTPASDDGAGFGRHGEMSDAALDDEAHTLGVRAAQVLHNIPQMEAGGLLMMPPEQDHSDATGDA